MVSKQKSRRSRSLRSRRKSPSRRRSKSRTKSRSRSKSRSKFRTRSKSSSRSRSPKKSSVPQTFKGDRNAMNKFFDRIFIMNLKDRPDRFEKVTKQFIKKGIKYTRYNAIDGRCKDCSSRQTSKKRKEMSEKYKMKIDSWLPPSAAAHILGTVELMKRQIRNKWKRILIFEDDMILVPGIMKKFENGIKDLPDKWDMLYLGCGRECGHRGISKKKTKKNKYLTPLSIVKSKNYKWYVEHKDDLRMPCDEHRCESVIRPDGHPSKYLSYAFTPTGNWAYCFTLGGAKKFLKFLDGRVHEHTDQLLLQAKEEMNMTFVSFDKPIVMHEEGALRSDSDIDWDWDD